MNESGMRYMYYIINTPVWWCSYGGPVPVLVSATCIAYMASYIYRYKSPLLE
jgi:hypothetical protein